MRIFSTIPALALTFCLSVALPLVWVATANASDDSYSDLGTQDLRAAVLRLQTNKIIQDDGCGGGKFCPEAPVLRKTAAVWLVRSLERAEPELSGAFRFSDVDQASPEAPYIGRLAELEITRGCGDGRFCPEGQIRRAHLAVFLSRAYDLPGASPSGDSFADVAAGAWYADAVGAVSSLGFVDDCQTDEGYFCPDEEVTRGELAIAIARAFRWFSVRKAKPPHRPYDIYLTRNDSGGLWIQWRKPWYSGSTPIEKYLLQWRAEGEEFDVSRQAEIGDVYRLSHTIEDVSSDAVYSVRVIAVNSVGPGEPSEVFKETDFDHSLLELSDAQALELDFIRSYQLSVLLRHRLVYYMENEMLPKYEEANPWLRDAWTHAKLQPGSFEVCIAEECGMSFDGHVDVDCQVSDDPEEQLPFCELSELTLRRQYTRDDALIAHELGHILTLANGVAEKPATLAMAFLYFVNLSDGEGRCAAAELYADTLESLAVDQSNAGYWRLCDQVPARPTAEARQVVEEALAGRIPGWFAERYLGDDWNYIAVWTDVNRLKNDHRSAVIGNLRDQFGGYCEPAAISSWPADVQPWRAGGCPPAE